MQRFDALVRRLVPAVPVLSRKRVLMGPLDLLDRVISMPFGVARRLPPNRLRIRVGVGNRILFNQMVHQLLPINFWIYAFSSGLVRMDSRILDLGSGCGRYAATLRDYDFFGQRFTGHYTGVDVDQEMVEWCRRNFREDRFTFKLAVAYSKVYNPQGDSDQAFGCDVGDAGQDFVFSASLLTHLLKPMVDLYLQETYRVLVPGAPMLMTFFCMDHLTDLLGGRWTFKHRMDDAYIENRDYPEAAVAYTRACIESACRQIGFESIETFKGGGQSLLRARKPG